MSIITGQILYDIIVVLVVVVISIRLYCKWIYTYWKKRNVPYWEPTVPWGNFRAPHRRILSFGDEVTQVYQRAKREGLEHVGLFSVTQPVYLPLNLDIVKNILTKDFNHFVDRGIYVNERDDPISAHLFAIGGKKWRNLRTKFTPTFTSGKMRVMFQVIADCGIKLEEYLNKELAHHEPIDIKYILGNFSTDVIGSCAFGLECNSFKDPNNPFRKMGNRIFNRTRFENLKLILLINFPNIAHAFRVRVTDKEINDFFTKVVDDTVKYREKNNVSRNDFVQLLIDIKNNKEGAQKPGDGTTLTLGEMTAQSFVFFIAGFETSSTTMTFALFELCKNQSIQDKVRTEIKQVLKKHNGKVTYDALNEMKYLSQVIDETLRKWPALPFITRVCVEDYVEPTTNLKFDKGTKVFIPIKGIHYDEDYYENPEEFDPERFSDENKSSKNQYTHIPFGEGPRMCIGMRFGIMQTKVGLISILTNFKVSLNKKTVQPIKLSVNSFVPQVEGGIWLDMEKIQ